MQLQKKILRNNIFLLPVKVGSSCFFQFQVIGSLIGKGGCHINEIRQFSGATVQVEESKKDSRMSDVIIAGTPEAVSCATFLINAR